MDDFLLAALFLWMTPLLTALSSLTEATLSALAAAEASPDSAAVLNLRIQVRSSLLTDLLRSVRMAFVLMGLSWDLIFATGTLSHIRVGRWCSVMRATDAARDRAWGYPWLSRSGWNCLRARPERTREGQI